MRQMKRFFVATLLAILGLTACTVDDGDDFATQPEYYEDSQAGQGDVRKALLTFDGKLLVMAAPPEAEWARLAGLEPTATDEAAHYCCFDATEMGYASQTTVYRLSPDARDGDGQPYQFRVRTAGGDAWLSLTFGADSELLLNHYNSTMTLALRVMAIHVADGATTSLGSNGRVFLFTARLQ